MKTPGTEKFFRILILAAIGAGIFAAWGTIVPFILETVKNTIGLAICLAFVGLVVLNFNTIKLWYFGFAKKLSSLLISIDPLSVMDGYLITLRKKYANLEEVRKIIEGKKIELTRLMQSKQQQAEEYKRLAISAQNAKEMPTAQLNANKLLQVNKTLELYAPIYRKYETNTKFLAELSENWKFSIDNLEFTIQNKREEFESIKAMFKGLKSAEDFLNSDSDEARIFGQSIKALEADVSLKLASIEDFEKKAEPIMTNIRVAKGADNADALKLLESLTKDNSLKLPDYQKISVTNAFGRDAETISFKEIKNNYGI
jgi:hypothetical protein